MNRAQRERLQAAFGGYHNQNLEASLHRLARSRSYKDLSTVWITPTRSALKPKVVSAFMSLQKPMNQPFIGPVFIEGEEVGVAYQKGFELVLDNADLSKWQYILTVEDDNLPPPDGLLRLYESIEKYDAVGGLYWTKGEGGQPMMYGDPQVLPRNFRPQMPQPGTVTQCNGLGMGFTLFRVEMFKKLPRPWFQTVQKVGTAFTQDLWFFNEAAKQGFKFACDARVRVGHLDTATGVVW